MSSAAVDENLTRKCAAARCRSCGRDELRPVLDLGMMPASDGLLLPEQLDEPEPRYPLEVAFCASCGLVQILETVPPDKLFGESYQYFSSFSDALLRHARTNALELVDRCGLDADSFVVEVASNDGYLLRNFVESGIPVLGIDPAPAPAAAARAKGIDTLCDFFTADLAERLATDGRAADLILASNVLAHVSDTNDFVRGLRRLVKPTGGISIEFPYVRDLVDHCEFDTIYHEHLCYFSVTSVDALLRRHGLYLNDIRRLSIHGGSLRLWVQPVEAVGDAVKAMLREEVELGIDRFDYYRDFAARVQGLRRDLLALLQDVRQQGKRIAAYGAAAKGTILLNALGLDRSTIEWVVDRNSHKHGRYMPGARIQILDPARLLEDMPDYVLILPWNFADEIIAQQSEYLARGGRFIVPIPTPRVVSAE